MSGKTKVDQLVASAPAETPPPESTGEVSGADAAELMLKQVAENEALTGAKPAAAKPKESKPKTNADVELMKARIAELEAQLAEAKTEAALDAPPVGMEKVGERVTFHHDSKLAVMRFPFRNPESQFVTGADGRPRLETKEPARPEARFQPHGVTNGGTYTTSDPEEIAYLESRTSDRSPNYHPGLQVWSREPIFKEVKTSG